MGTRTALSGSRVTATREPCKKGRSREPAAAPIRLSLARLLARAVSGARRDHGVRRRHDPRAGPEKSRRGYSLAGPGRQAACRAGGSETVKTKIPKRHLKESDAPLLPG